MNEETPSPNNFDLIVWATRTIKQWDEHDRYRTPVSELEMYKLNGFGYQPEIVWIARGILNSIEN